MKKKKVIILTIVISLFLIIFFMRINGEFKIVEIADVSEEEIITKENLLFFYEIIKNEGTLTAEERETENWDWEQQQYATLCIFSDGTVYFFNTHERVIDSLKDGAFSEVLDKAYYLGKISTLDLLFLKINMFLIDTESLPEYYDSSENLHELDGVTDENNEETYVTEENSADVGLLIKEENYSCYFYNIEGAPYRWHLISQRSTAGGTVWKKSTDDNARITLDWLRSTWYFEQYIDLMYQELYPWLVEE